MLRLDRLRALVDVYPGVDREDEMVAAFDFCRHGRRRRGAVDRHGDARPRRGTARRPPPPRRRHRPGHRGRRRGADQGVLRRPRRVGAVAPARLPARPRHRRGPALAPAGHRRHPRRPRHHGVGRDERRSARPTRSRSSAPPRRSSTSAARPSRSAPWSPATSRCPTPSGRARAALLAPVIRGLASTDRPQVGHFTDSDVVLDFCSREKLAALAALGTSCPDHFLRTKVRPLVLDLPATAPIDEVVARLRRAPRGLPRGLPRLLRAPRRRRTRRRCAAPIRPSCSCPASACSRSAPTSRRRASPASSTSTRST